MEPFRYHVFICDQQKPEGVPCCAARNSAATVEALRKELAAHGIADEVQVTLCGSLGVCERGPNVVVDPEGVSYSRVWPEDVSELVESQFVQGRGVERLVNRDAGGLRTEIQSNRAIFMAAHRANAAALMLSSFNSSGNVHWDESQAVTYSFLHTHTLPNAVERWRGAR